MPPRPRRACISWPQAVSPSSLRGSRRETTWKESMSASAIMAVGRFEPVEEPGLRKRPVALQRCHRDTKRFSRLALGEPGEVTELHDAAGARLDHLELRQRLVEGH